MNTNPYFFEGYISLSEKEKDELGEKFEEKMKEIGIKTITTLSTNNSGKTRTSTLRIK